MVAIKRPNQSNQSMARWLSELTPRRVRRDPEDDLTSKSLSGHKYPHHLNHETLLRPIPSTTGIYTC